jgi:antitoxin (DNA-binding transcriptional repressor) of toxin-antitoxin stability system
LLFALSPIGLFIVTIDIKEFENHPGDYLGKIQSTGESITILAEAKPIALLIPLAAAKIVNGATLIDRLIAQPLPIKDFTPLSRAGIYRA